MDDFNEAINAHKKVVELRPEFTDAYKALGVMYLKAGRFEDLEETINTALQYEKEDYQLYYILSSAYMAKKKMTML